MASPMSKGRSLEGKSVGGHQWGRPPFHALPVSEITGVNRSR